MSKQLKGFLILFVSVFCLMFLHQKVDAATPGFFTGSSGYLFYADEQGNIVRNKSIEYKGNTYFVHANGHVLRSTIVYWDGKQYTRTNGATGFGKIKRAYIVDAKGRAYKNKAVKYRGKVYIAGDNKRVFINTFVYYDGKKYVKNAKNASTIKATFRVDKKGRRLDGARISHDGQYYFSQKNGKLFKNRFINYKSKKYYVDKNGRTVPNKWITIGNSLYRTKAKGEVRVNQTFTMERAKYTIAKNGEITNTVMPMPVLSQRGDFTSFGNSTISQYGCGVVSTAMGMSYLTGRNISVREMRDVANPYYDTADAYTNGKLHDAFFGHAAKVYGKKSKITTNAEEALAAAKRGCAVLSFQRRPSIFAYYGHYIIIKAVDSNNRVRVNDPNNTPAKNHNNRTFDFYKDINVSSVKYVIFSQ